MNQEYDLCTCKYLNESNANDENIKANPKSRKCEIRNCFNSELSKTQIAIIVQN